ncbi:hypothetical protein BM527_16685 [Alteromonas sp. Mex14]|nr:hypothetical protein BM527_16685 [Alteromonas sp. Mex14]
MYRHLAPFILATVFYASNTCASSYHIGFVPPADNSEQQGFLRFINTSADRQQVVLSGLDDSGQAGVTTILFSLLPGESKQMNSDDLEFGNQEKGLTGYFGDGTGSWRITVQAEEVKTSAYIRTSEGFLTQVDAFVPNAFGKEHEIPMFNPSSNSNQVSKLRIINNSDVKNVFEITGTDNKGRAPGGVLSFTLEPREAIEISSSDIEKGNPNLGLIGSIGDGVGKWLLKVQSTQPSMVLNLLEAPGGYLSNLSQYAEKSVSPQLLRCSDLDGARVYGTQEPPIYLGFLGSESASESIYNPSSRYGSNSEDGLLDKSSRFGSSDSPFSHLNNKASSPPVVVKNGDELVLLTTNPAFGGGVPLDEISVDCIFSSEVPHNTFSLEKLGGYDPNGGESEYCTNNFCVDSGETVAVTISLNESEFTKGSIDLDDSFNRPDILGRTTFLLETTEGIVEISSVSQSCGDNSPPEDCELEEFTNSEIFYEQLTSGTFSVKATNAPVDEFGIGNNERYFRVGLRMDQGFRVGDVALIHNNVVINRPIAGTAIREGGMCNELSIAEVLSLRGESYNITNLVVYPDKVFGNSGETDIDFIGWSTIDRVLACSNTPTGDYTVNAIALDGVGGKRTLGKLTISVVEARIPGGAVVYK